MRSVLEPTPPPTAVGDPEDMALMRLVAGGDARAQRLLAKRISERGFRIARAFAGSDADAYDVLQDALFEVFRSASQFRGEASLDAWVERIFVRRAIRYVRRTKQPRLRRETLVETQALANEPVPPADPRLELLAAMDRYASALPPKLQQVLRLRFVMGHTIPEIAALTNMSPATVKKRVVEAVQAIRESLASERVNNQGGDS